MPGGDLLISAHPSIMLPLGERNTLHLGGRIDPLGQPNSGRLAVTLAQVLTAG